MIRAALVLLVVGVAPVRAESWATPVAKVDDAAAREHLLHVELVTGIVTNGISVDYERTIDPRLAVRVGYGASFVIAADDGVRSAHGPLVMLTSLWGRRAMFELAAGASLVTTRDDIPVGLPVAGSWHLVPNLAVGFRYQAKAVGPMFRVAFAWTSAYGVPCAFGVGWGF